MIWKKSPSFREGITEGVRNSWSCGIHGQEAEINVGILAYFLFLPFYSAGTLVHKKLPLTFNGCIPFTNFPGNILMIQTKMCLLPHSKSSPVKGKICLSTVTGQT